MSNSLEKKRLKYSLASWDYRPEGSNFKSTRGQPVKN